MSAQEIEDAKIISRYNEMITRRYQEDRSLKNLPLSSRYRLLGRSVRRARNLYNSHNYKYRCSSLCRECILQGRRERTSCRQYNSSAGI